MSAGVTRRRFLEGAAAAATWAGSAGTAAGSGRRADLVVRGGPVLTLDPRFRIAEALAIADGKVLAVGRERDLRALADHRTEVIDASGGSVLPGINDSHVHLNSLGLTFPPFSFDVDAAAIEELVARIGDAAATAVPGAWIRGRGWNDTRLPRAPNRHDLDPVSDGHPAVLVDFSLHATAVNTRVLELAGVTRDTVPPAGGVIEKDGNGEPTGVFREGAQALVQAVVPPYTRDELAQATEVAVEVMHAQGVTSVTEPGISAQLLDVYADKAAAGRLPLRLTALLHAGPSPATMREALAQLRQPRRVSRRRLNVAGVKIFADGIPTGAKTAWLHGTYVDGSNGSLTIEGGGTGEQLANLDEMIRLANAAGAQIGTHATGDATIDAVVDSYLRALAHAPRRNARHYVIHGDLAPPTALAAMGRAGIGCNMNAQIKFLIDRALDPILGPERTDHHWPYRSALDRGVRVSSGSDAPVTVPNWLQGVATAVLREGRLGNVAGEDERITVPEAVRTYTSTPAWQDFAERWKGTLEPGRVADVCVLEQNVLELDPHDLAAVSANVTILAGEPVYERTRASAPTTASRRSSMNAAHGLACYQGGVCCCTLSETIRSGGGRTSP